MFRFPHWEKKLSKLILTNMNIEERPCTVCAFTEENRVMELRLSPAEEASILGNIYVGRVDSIAANIGAAFVKISPEETCYMPLKEASRAVFSAGRKGNAPLRPGDELLVQVNRAAMKGKLPSVTTELNFTGKYMVLTSRPETIGYSSKLSQPEKKLLEKWLGPEVEDPKRSWGAIVRTNAGEAEKADILQELQYLKEQYERVTSAGRNRTCYSLLWKAMPAYMEAVRDVYSRDLEEIVTDVSEIYQAVQEWLSEVNPAEAEKLRFYEDKLLPLYKLYRLESAVEEIRREKIWLNSGGFLVIQQTEAFVVIDVNSGKYTSKKKAEEGYRKINLEAAGEIARQLRLRNLSGIILIDFINMKNPDHRDELFHVLQKHLRKDPVKAAAVDITPLHILEMTRKKVRCPVVEELKEIGSERHS